MHGWFQVCNKSLVQLRGVTIDKLVSKTNTAESEREFIKETITVGFQQAQEGRFAAKGLSSLDELVAELREEAV